MDFRRITLFAGHFGSGKTNLAVNYALELRRHFERVAIADLDIVNPYFRTKDSEEALRSAGIRFISSPYANSNLDVPSIPAEAYSIIDDRKTHAVVDVGGDDRGALALGRYSPAINQENNYEMLLVINKFRPLTREGGSAVDIMREIEAAAGLKFTAIINNSNLGQETVPEDVLDSLEYARTISEAACIPVKLTSVREDLYPALQGSIPNLFPITLFHKPFWAI
jgi:hypothetical protein